MNCKPVCTSSSVILFSMLLASCAERETPDQLHAQLETIRRGAPATAPLIHPTSDFISYRYNVADDQNAVTPFGRPSAVVTDAVNERPRQRGAKQPLEDVPLESIRMVGTLSRGGRTDALLQVDKIVYPSRTGDYLGLNFGVIRSVANGRVELEELIRSNGEWEKRMTTLELQGHGK